MTQPTIRVIKVGGSLLWREQMPRLLTSWLTQMDRNHANQASQHTAWRNVLVAGGGVLADHVRQLDQRFSLNAEAAHWMSIDVMSCTSRLLASLVDVQRPVQRWDDLRASLAGDRTSPIVFDVRQWLAELEAAQRGVPLTLDWRSTSDSIAARLAQVLSAEELVLLKSTGIPDRINWQEAAAEGLVDEHFPNIAAELPSVVWVDLRRFERLASATKQS